MISYSVHFYIGYRIQKYLRKCFILMPVCSISDIAILSVYI